MVMWRYVAGHSPLRHWWDDGNRQLAFSRAGRAFLAINDDSTKSMNVELETGLPAGVYCDVTSGTLTPDGLNCTGRTVTGNQCLLLVQFSDYILSNIYFLILRIK